MALLERRHWPQPLVRIRWLRVLGRARRCCARIERAARAAPAG
jgi:hypothetical protein